MKIEHNPEMLPVFNLFFFALQVSAQITTTNLVHISSELGLDNPLILGETVSRKVKLIKPYFSYGKYVSSSSSANVIVFFDTSRYVTKEIDVITHFEKGLIIGNDSTIDKLIHDFDFDISKEVYVMKEYSGQIFEKYTINNIPVTKLVATTNISDNHFQINWKLDSNMVSRRSDFQGIHF